MICLNARFSFNPVTGVERYAHEVSRRLAQHLLPIAPPGPRNGLKGHLWEQFFLPGKLGGRLLWSPCNTGPLRVERQVVTIHDMAALDHPEWMAPAFAAWYAFLLPRLARHCRLVLTVSQFSRDRIIAHCKIPPEKVVSVPLAAAPNFRPAPWAEIEALCQAMGLVPGRYLLSLSSIEPRKNLPGLLNAWELALPHLPDDVWLVLGGKLGPNRVFAPVGLGSLPPRVKVTGYLPDEKLPALYSGAAFFVYVSFYEGFGLPLLEAMACGTPIISSDRGSMPEVAGDCGHLVDPYSTAAIAERLVASFAREARTGECQKARARAAQFTWERTAAMTWDAIQNVM